MKKPPFDIVVLRHWREKSRDTNSGQLVTDCIAGARVVDMVDESYKNLAAHLPKGDVWLLFPESIDSAGNVVVPTHRGLPDPLPKTIVVVDGTWAEAQRMAKALPGLPRLVPQGGPRASERLLTPPQAGAMATAEAIAALIAEVDPYAAACLDRAYARHVSSLKKSNPYKAAIPIVSGIAYVANPKMVPDVPIEATVRSERIGTKTRELTPGVHVVAQISRTGKEVWLTQGEQRLFLYLQDEQGRGSLFYQSFAGTGGKAQGYWFPSGGILASRRGSGVWVIKGNPKTDPGAGREGLLALYEKANAVLPHSDAETDDFVKKATRVPYDDFLWEDEYEIKPTMKILEEGQFSALQTKWNDWAYRFWSLNALDKTWGKRTFNIKENPMPFRRNNGKTYLKKSNPYKVVIPSVRGISFARRNPSSSSELYHATLSGKNNEIVLSMIDGIDTSRAQGHGQGAGFYLFTNRKEAVDHARGLVSSRGFVKEVKVEGEPIIVVVDAPLTPENYDADYEVSAADFRRFLFEHKDWIRDNANKLGLVFVPASSGTSKLTGEAYSQPDRIQLIVGTSRSTFTIMAEPPADDAASVGLAERLSILAQRIAAVSPELLLQFEESTLKTMPAVKYVGPKIQPARIERPDGTVVWQRNARSNPLVGFERVPWKPSYSPRSEATFLSTAYPRLWEEALKNTDLKIRVLIARDAAHMGDIGKNLMAINAAAKRGGEIVILILALSETGSYALEGMIAETKPGVGDSQRLSRPSPFMILHNLAEGLMNEPEVARRVMRQDGLSSVPRSSIDPAHVDTWAGRRGALEDSGNALADLFAKYVTTGKVAYNGSSLEISAIRQDLDVMVDYLKRNPGVYEILSGYRKLPASESDLKSLSMPAREAREIPIDLEGLFLNNPTDLAGRHVPDRYLAGLPAALQKQRIGELTQSRDDYKLGDYSELPTDVTARKMGLVKQSQYTTEAKIRGIEYRGDLRDMAQRVLAFYGRRPSAREVEAFAEALRASFAKGLAAWKSGGHRPGATAQNWAVARVNSLVVGGKTSWTADKKLFEVLPAAVRAKIESMRQKQNPISVEVRLDGGYPAGYGGADEGKHTRFLQSKAALARIVDQGKEVVPRIKFVVDWDKNAAAKRLRIGKGERGVMTLIASAATLQSRADDAEKGGQARSGGPVSRDRKVSLYTAHTILHRLGDRIMPRPEDVMFMSLDSPAFVDRRAALVVTARVENAWRLLGEALAAAWNHTGGSEGLNRWLPTVVDTKACREGWVIDGQQAMAELVPYRLLYKKGREQGVKLMSDLPFVPRLEKAFTNYIDACIDMLTGQEVLI